MIAQPGVRAHTRPPSHLCLARGGLAVLCVQLLFIKCESYIQLSLDVVIFILIDLDIILALLGASLDSPLVPKALANNIDIIEYFLFVRIDKNLYITVQSKLVSSSDLYCLIKFKLAILNYFTEIQINTIILLKLNVSQNMNYGLPATT